MSKAKSVVKQEYKHYADLFEYINRCIVALHHEVGNPDKPPSLFKKHEDKHYSISHSRKRFKVSIELVGGDE